MSDQKPAPISSLVSPEALAALGSAAQGEPAFDNARLCKMMQQTMAEPKPNPFAALSPQRIREMTRAAGVSHRTPPKHAEGIPLFLPTREEWGQLVSLLESQIQASRDFAAAAEAYVAGRAENIAALNANTRALEVLAAELRRQRSGDEWKGDDADAAA